MTTRPAPPAPVDRVDDEAAPDLSLTRRHTSALLEEALADLDGWLGAADLPTREGDVPTLGLGAWLRECVFGGGKGIRPTMCHWGYVAAGGRRDAPGHEHVARVAAALEMLHVFALIHDDVMDESYIRRGRPTVHARAAREHAERGGLGASARFGESIAILLGDLAHTLADQLASQLPRRFHLPWWSLSVELMAGQAADLSGSASAVKDVARSTRIADLKSGSYTVVRPLQLGALAAGHGDGEVVRLLTAYGVATGRAFALRDDLLGVWGDPQATGKPAGDDLVNRKPTPLWAAAEATLRGSDREALDRVGTSAARPDDTAVVAAAMERAGIRADAEQDIARSVERARAALEEGRAAGVLTALGVDGLTRCADKIAWRVA